MPGAPMLVGLPFDAASSYRRGAAAAPPLVRAELRSPAGNGWSEDGVDTLAPDTLLDYGDVTVGDDATGEHVRAAIERAIARVVADGHRPLSVGGDHAVTYSVLRALRPAHPRLTVVQIDAHPDLYEDYEGDRFSHACPFARAMEERLCDRLVQVGVRTMNAHQRTQAERYGVETIDMRAWASGARPTVNGPVYVTLDLDGLDPAFAPGVSHREPGGLTVREVLTIIQTLGGTLVGADVVELNPSRDVDGLTTTVCAKLVRELAGRMIGER